MRETEPARVTRPAGALDGLGLDIRLGFRMLCKNWGLTLVGGLAMTVVIAICATAFVILETVGWSTLPLDEDGRIVNLSSRDPLSRDQITSLADFELWREAVKSVRQLAAYRTIERELASEQGSARRVLVAEMTAFGFRVAGVAPLMGRTLLEEDEQPTAQSVVVISHDLWKSRFMGNPQTVGEAIQLGGRKYTVVGVMPDGFGFPVNYYAWVPLAASALATAPAESFEVFGTLAPNVSIETARAELEAVGAARRSASGGPKARPVTQLVTFSDSITVPGTRALAVTILTLIVLLLVPPCANIAILIYARNLTRTEEFAARYVLGASRFRIVGQLLMEALVLAATSGAVAILVSERLLRWIRDYIQNDADLRRAVPYWMRPELTIESVLYVAVLVFLAALIAGGFPALRATGFARSASFQNLGRSGSPRLGWTWKALVAGQVTLSAAVLPVAGVIAWDSLKPWLLGPGFDATPFLTAQLVLELPPPGGGAGETAAPLLNLQAEFIQQVQLQTGITAVAVSTSVHGLGERASLQPDTGDAAPIAANRNAIDSTYFRIFDLALLTGRAFSARDFDVGSQVAVVNRAFAVRLARGGAAANALGARVRRAAPVDQTAPSESPWFEVVGVVDDRLMDGDPTIYFPLNARWIAAAAGHLSLTLRTGAEIPAGLAGRLQQIAGTVNPNLRVEQLRFLDNIYRNALVEKNAGGLGLATVVGIVLLFSAAGIYTLAAFVVAQRRREIAIRSALGAQPHRVILEVFRSALFPVVAGAILGGVVALALRSLTDDDISMAIAYSACFMILMGLLSVAGPARRALQVDAVEELRNK